MQTIFDEDLVFSFQEIVEQSVAEFFNSDGHGMASFQESLRDGVNSICTTIQQRLLEHIDQELVDDCSLREGWVVAHRDREKTILSPFGPVTYHRTYFQNKKTGKYAYLADRLSGYTPHQRLDTLLEADVMKDAIKMSFREAGRRQERRAKGTGVTGQTVLNIVRSFEPERLMLKEKPQRKRKCRIIYIEADEDHIAHQDKDTHWFEQKLVYVHEGRKKIGKDRYELVGKKYFTFDRGTTSEKIWSTILNYLFSTYDLEETSHIFISGDGAGWIKAGAEYIPDSYYVMDGFHLRQAIFRAAGADEDNRKDLSQAIWDGKWAKMNRLLLSFREEAEQESRQNAIFEVQKYLCNNWPGIQARRKYNDLLVGCSAEGHVSHVLSARLSSRPMGWSYLGADQMAHLRVQKANGVNVPRTYIKQKTRETKSFVSQHLSDQTSRPVKKAVGGSLETFGNVPSLRSGTRAFAPLLRRIAHTTLKL